MRKNRKRSLFRLLLMHVLLCMITLVVRSNVQAKSPTVQTKKPVISEKKLTLEVGKTKTLKMKYISSNVKWTTSSKKIVSIKASGKKKAICRVTAKKSGKATIKAKVGKKTYKCIVTVKEKANPVMPLTPSQESTNPSGEPAKAITSNQPMAAVSSAPTNIPSKKTNQEAVDPSGEPEKVTTSNQPMAAPSAMPTEVPNNKPSQEPTSGSIPETSQEPTGESNPKASQEPVMESNPKASQVPANPSTKPSDTSGCVSENSPSISSGSLSSNDIVPSVTPMSSEEPKSSEMPQPSETPCVNPSMAPEEEQISAPILVKKYDYNSFEGVQTFTTDTSLNQEFSIYEPISTQKIWMRKAKTGDKQEVILSYAVPPMLKIPYAFFQTTCKELSVKNTPVFQSYYQLDMDCSKIADKVAFTGVDASRIDAGNVVIHSTNLVTGEEHDTPLISGEVRYMKIGSIDRFNFTAGYLYTIKIPYYNSEKRNIEVTEYRFVVVDAETEMQMVAKDAVTAQEEENALIFDFTTLPYYDKDDLDLNGEDFTLISVLMNKTERELDLTKEPLLTYQETISSMNGYTFHFDSYSRSIARYKKYAAALPGSGKDERVGVKLEEPEGNFFRDVVRGFSEIEAPEGTSCDYRLEGYGHTILVGVIDDAEENQNPVQKKIGYNTDTGKLTLSWENLTKKEVYEYLKGKYVSVLYVDKLGNSHNLNYQFE